MRVGVGTNFNVSNLSIVRGIAYCYEDFSCSLEPTIPLPLFDPDNFDDLEAFAEKIYEDSLRDHIIFTGWIISLLELFILQWLIVKRNSIEVPASPVAQPPSLAVVPDNCWRGRFAALSKVFHFSSRSQTVR